MYERFYQLRERPFALSPDPDYLYPSRVHQEALDYLRYGVESQAGFIVITGEIGSGKTTLLQTLLRSLDSQTTVGRIVNTMLEPRELLETIMIDFGLDPTGRSKPLLLRDLSQYLVDQRLAGRLVLLVIDEAQNLGLGALEELRMLSNLETEKSKLLQIVLVGQPNLRDKLAAPELEQLRQRITVSYHLPPLDADETGHYINHRLRRAALGAPLEFPRDVTDLIHARSRGVPRIINVICDAALVFGYARGAPGVRRSRLIAEVLPSWKRPACCLRVERDRRSRSIAADARDRRRRRCAARRPSPTPAASAPATRRASSRRRRPPWSCRARLRARAARAVRIRAARARARRAAPRAGRRIPAAARASAAAAGVRRRRAAAWRPATGEPVVSGASADVPQHGARDSTQCTRRRLLGPPQTHYARCVCFIGVELMAASVETLREKIRSRTARTGVVGLGYVGLPLAVEFAQGRLPRDRHRSRRAQGRRDQRRPVLHPRRADRRRRGAARQGRCSTPRPTSPSSRSSTRSTSACRRRCARRRTRTCPTSSRRSRGSRSTCTPAC